MPSGVVSNLNTAFCHSLGRVIRAKQGLPRNSVQGRVLSGLCVSYPFSSHTGIPGSLCLKKNLSATYSGPSVFDTTSEVFECPSKMSIAASGSKAACASPVVSHSVTSFGKVSRSAKATNVCYNFRNLRSCQKANLSLRNRESAYSSMASGGCLMINVSTSSCNYNALIGPWLKGFSTSSSQCYSDGVVPDVSLEGTLGQEQLVNSAGSPEHDKTLKLLSGSCYLPHPDKEETGGEDAHFICVDEQAIGVADGVGGWADVGINAGLYARELMSYSVAAIQEEPKGLINPAKVLEKAHSLTKAKGSSTACIIALTDQGLHAINLGDSGFIVVRDGCTIFQSPVQQHGFNFTFQLDSGNQGDLPSSGQVFNISVANGDAIVAGTDGLFDNLYNNEITAVVDHAVKAGLDPQVTAQKITALARQRALDRGRQTPFSTAAQEAGFRYFGGKLDDITVVVSYITGATNA